MNYFCRSTGKLCVNATDLGYCKSTVCTNAAGENGWKVEGLAKRNAELHAELEKWVSAAEKAGEPKRGVWVLKERAHYFKCSICKEPIPYKFGYGGNRYYNYCPHCGAKMRGYRGEF